MQLTLCPLFSGSSGNAVYVQGGATSILIDAGVSGRAVEQALAGIGASAASLQGILVTHEHDDHIKGVGVLSRRYDIPIYANEATWLAMEDKLGKVRDCNRRVFDAGQDFYIRDLGIQTFCTPHDAAQPVGYACACGRYKVAVATDLGCVTSTVLRAVQDSDTVLLEANHDVELVRHSRYPRSLQQRILGNRGHLCNEAAGDLALRLAQSGVGNIMLGHLSAENNSERLALDAVCLALRQGGVSPGADVQLHVAHRSRTSARLVLAE